jgi:hypothetical protein
MLMVVPCWIVLTLPSSQGLGFRVATTHAAV